MEIIACWPFLVVCEERRYRKKQISFVAGQDEFKPSAIKIFVMIVEPFVTSDFTFKQNVGEKEAESKTSVMR